MRLLVIRHGETEENARHICQGQTPGTLSPKGKSQAEALGKRLRKEPLVVCYSSDQRRASDTASIILSTHEGRKVPIILDKRLRERYFGSFEGKVFPPYSDEVVPLEEVETAETIRERLRSFLEEIKPLYGKEDTVMIVSHGFTLRVLAALFRGTPLSSLGEISTPDNCDLTEYFL